MIGILLILFNFLSHIFIKDMSFYIKRGETMSERIILDDAAIQRTITRIAHEILEYNKEPKI